MVFNLSKEILLQKTVYYLVFLFPVFAMSIRGWNAYIFSSLVVLSLLSIKKSRDILHEEEKTILLIFLAAFVVFVASSVVNEWDREATKMLGTELMFLFFIPLYLLIRRYDDAGKWLIRGVIAGALVLGLQSGYELEYLNRYRATGIYSPIIFGSFAVLYGFITIGSFKFSSRNLIYGLTILLSIGASLYAVAFAGSRGAYVAILTLIVGLVFVRYRNWRGGVILGTGLALLMVAYLSVPYVKSRTDQAAHNTISYFQKADNVNSKAGNTSAGHHG